jgi:4-diphosphocytidyl-2-C-methyl-D-erythritol kinase
MPRPEAEAREVLAHAKVNLVLRVLAREENGYHQIETVFQGLELADRLRIAPRTAAGVELRLSGPEARGLGPSEDNLVVRAARAWLEAAGEVGRSMPGVTIELDKRIPHGAGLGGGSSDAAAVLRAMDMLATEPLGPDTRFRLGGDLGADVPFFLTGASRALAWGRGDRLFPLDPLPVRPVLLALPDRTIPTPWAYAKLAEKRAREGRGYPGALGFDPAALRGWQGMVRMAENAFEPALDEEVPELSLLVTALRAEGARLAMLSGSGSAVYGVFDHGAAAEAARERLAGVVPGMRTCLTRTLGEGDGEQVGE